MKRPIGVTILASLAGLAGLANLWRVGVYLGWFKFNAFGEVSFSLPGGQPGRRPVGARHGGDLVLGRLAVLEHACSGLAVRRVHQPVHPHLGLLRDPVGFVPYR